MGAHSGYFMLLPRVHPSTVELHINTTIQIRPPPFQVPIYSHKNIIHYKFTIKTTSQFRIIPHIDNLLHYLLFQLISVCGLSEKQDDKVLLNIGG